MNVTSLLIFLQTGKNTRYIYKNQIPEILQAFVIKEHLKSLDDKIRESKKKATKEALRISKKGIKKKYDFEMVQSLVRSYADYRPSSDLYKLSKIKKDFLDDYKKNFGKAKSDHGLAVIPVEAAFGFLYQLCLKFNESENVTSINNRMVKECLPPNITGINNNLICYFLEAMGRASDLPLSTRQMALATRIYDIVRDAGGFGISQFVLTPERLGIAEIPRIKKLTKYLQFKGDSKQITKEINSVLIAFGNEPLRDLTQKEIASIRNENQSQSPTDFDEGALLETFRKDLAAKVLQNEFENEGTVEENEDKENQMNEKTSETGSEQNESERNNEEEEGSSGSSERSGSSDNSSGPPDKSSEKSSGEGNGDKGTSNNSEEGNGTNPSDESTSALKILKGHISDTKYRHVMIGKSTIVLKILKGHITNT